MRALIGLTALAALAGCQQPTETATMKALREEDRANLVNGRYQMLPGPDHKVYVLDTRDGWIRLCGPTDSADSMGCGAAADQ